MRIQHKTIGLHRTRPGRFIWGAIGLALAYGAFLWAVDTARLWLYLGAAVLAVLGARSVALGLKKA
jgi:hypothetical protein